MIVLLIEHMSFLAMKCCSSLRGTKQSVLQILGVLDKTEQLFTFHSLLNHNPQIASPAIGGIAMTYFIIHHSLFDIHLFLVLLFKCFLPLQTQQYHDTIGETLLRLP